MAGVSVINGLPQWTQHHSTEENHYRMSKLGVVVVGMGLAGKVRVRDIKLSPEYSQAFSQLEGVQLVGFVSRRDIDIEGVDRLPTFEDALKRDDVNIIVICTENKLHATMTRQALEAKKHVLCEFPLANTSSEAKQLQDLAKQNDLCLCEEDIALLTDDHKKLKTLMKEKPLQEGHLLLEGRYNGWIEDVSSSGSPFHSSISKIQMLLSLLGDLDPVEASIKVSDNSISTYGKVVTKTGIPITMKIDRVKDGAGRKQSYCYKFTDGTTVESPPPKRPDPPQPPNNPGLFMKDFISFVEKLKDGKDHEPNDWMTVRSLEIADKLFDLAKHSSDSIGLS